MSELTDAEAAGLAKIKAQMNQGQRAEMAEIIRKEMERRGMIEGSAKKSTVKAAGISGGLNSEQVKELYQDVGQAMQQLKVKQLEEKLAAARGKATRKKSFSLPSLPSLPIGGNAERIAETGNFEVGVGRSAMKTGLLYGVCGLAALMIAFTLGLFDPTPATAKPATESEKTPMVVASASSKSQQEVAPAQSFTSGAKLWSPAEKDVLTQLDARRVELERRKEALDRREGDLKNQAQIITERLAELRGLTAKMQELRKEREHKQEGRLAQLANVYGAMEPAEASNLIARLDDGIALELLERMPEKRMGQVLSFMEKGRAVDLTKLLTEKKVVE